MPEIAASTSKLPVIVRLLSPVVVEANVIVPPSNVLAPESATPSDAV